MMAQIAPVQVGHMAAVASPSNRARLIDRVKHIIAIFIDVVTQDELAVPQGGHSLIETVAQHTRGHFSR